jgi:DNA-binding NarL/FixJ family response regulator
VPDPVGIGGIVAALSVTSDLTRGHPPLPAGLTERELEVLRRLAAGCTKREIALDGERMRSVDQ